MTDILYTFVKNRSKSVEVKELTDYIIGNADICKGLVKQSYIENDSILKADALMLAYRMDHKYNTRKPIKKVVGFAILQYRADHVFVDVVCASGHGREIMKKIETHARRMHKQYITLNALPHVINFYRRLGYKHQKTCRKGESRNIRKLAESVSKLRFTPTARKNELEKAFTDYKFRHLLQALVDNKLVAKKTCTNINMEDNSGCSQHGYVMSKCLMR